MFDFNGAGDNLSFLWTVPEGIDTSTPIEIKLDYSASANDTFDLDLSASKLLNATPISSSPAPDFTNTTAITAAAANTFYVDQTLTPNGVSIQNLSPGDTISVELERTDTTNSFYPFSVTIHYLVFSIGEKT